MKNKIIGILVCMLLLATGITVVADWEVGDGHIMHYPQLPDPYGLDVNFHDWWLGDDWYSGDITREVTDIHFWYSWKNDTVQDIPWIHVSIWSDNAGPPSKPFEELWNREFTADEFIIAGPFGGGVQGWYHPPDIFIPNEHEDYYQINILNILDPFEQHAGETYWLVIQMPYYSIPGIGWKTSQDNFRDNAVYGSPSTGWEPLWDPRNPGEPIDFAFVINGIEVRPDLACEGTLWWMDIRPGDAVTGEFKVGNIGSFRSTLEWEVISWPSWGTNWVFTPSNGTLAAGSWTNVTVTVKAPNQKNQNFTGNITIVNKNDTTDYCEIDVSVTTPKNKPFSFHYILLSWLFNRFPNLFLILKYI